MTMAVSSDEDDRELAAEYGMELDPLASYQEQRASAQRVVAWLFIANFIAVSIATALVLA